MDKEIVKYALLTLAFVIISAGCSDYDELDGQVEWFPIGAVWDIFKRPEHYIFTVERDTIVASKKCQVIEGVKILNINKKIGEEIVYEKNGKVYYYFKNKFRMIYDCNAKVGDVVDFEFKTSDAINEDEVMDNLNTTIILPCRIEKIETKVIDGVVLREFSARYTYTGTDPRLNFEYLHVYREKVGIEPYHNIITDGIFPVCPDRGVSTVFLYNFQDHEIEYFPRWWSVRLTLKPQPNADYLATEDPEIIALVLKHGVEFRLSAPGIPQFLLLYDLSGKDGRKIVMKDFFATGKFEEKFYEYKPTSYSNGILKNKDEIIYVTNY